MINGLFYCDDGIDPYLTMAFDEYLYAKAHESPGMLAIRLYRWSPGAITIGYHQRKERAIDFDKLGQTIALRRATGGRAIYHDTAELTYSVVFHNNGIYANMFGRTARETSLLIAEILVDFLNRLGVSSEFRRSAGRTESDPKLLHKLPCFSSTARHEIVVDDKKVIASASTRSEKVLLQQGSIKLHGVTQHTALPESSDKTRNKQFPSLIMPFSSMCELLTQSFQGYAGIELTQSDLSSDEKRLISGYASRMKLSPFSQRCFS